MICSPGTAPTPSYSPSGRGRMCTTPGSGGGAGELGFTAGRERLLEGCCDDGLPHSFLFQLGS